jgi:hypothetical protein
MIVLCAVPRTNHVRGTTCLPLPFPDNTLDRGSRGEAWHSRAEKLLTGGPLGISLASSEDISIRPLTRDTTRAPARLVEQNVLLEEILNDYIVAAGLQSGQFLFQTVNSTDRAVTGRALNRYKPGLRFASGPRRQVF